MVRCHISARGDTPQTYGSTSGRWKRQRIGRRRHPIAIRLRGFTMSYLPFLVLGFPIGGIIGGGGAKPFPIPGAIFIGLPVFLLVCCAAICPAAV